MNAKKWTIGIVVSFFFSMLTAGAGLSAGMKWQAFIAVFCAAAVTNLGAYLMKHPVESIIEESESRSKSTAPDGSTRQVDVKVHTETPVASAPLGGLPPQE